MRDYILPIHSGTGSVARLKGGRVEDAGKEVLVWAPRGEALCAIGGQG